MQAELVTESMGSRKSWPYDVFISYSRTDAAVATALERGLRRLTKPLPISRRALRVFRDTVSLGAGGDLPGRLRDAVDASRYFLFVASPHSAASEWAREEVTMWLERRGTENLIIAVVGGTWEWDRVRGRFDPEHSDALPPALIEAFDSEPILVDLRWAGGTSSLSLRDSRFRGAVADLAAPVHGRPRDELESEDLRRRRLGRAIACAAVCAVLVAAGVAVWQAVRARAAERQANDRAREAVAGRLASQGELGNVAPDVAMALLAAANGLEPSSANQNALLRTMAATPLESWTSGPADPSQAWLHVALSSGGTYVATLDVRGQVDVWDTATGQRRPSRFVTMDPNGGTPLIVEARGAAEPSGPISMLAPDPASIGMIGAMAVDDAGDVVLATLTGHLAWLTSDDGFSTMPTNCIGLENLRIEASVHDGTFTCWDVPGPDDTADSAVQGPPEVAWFHDQAAVSSRLRNSIIAASDVNDAGTVAVALSVDTSGVDDEWYVSVLPADGAGSPSDYRVTDLVTDVAIAPDGSRMAVATQRGQIQLFSLEDGSELALRRVGYDPLASLTFSADGTQLLAGDTAGHLLVLDGTTLDPERDWTAHTATVSDAVAAPDGQVVSTDGRNFAQWSGSGNALSRETAGASGDVMAVATLSENRVLAAADNGFQLLVGPVDHLSPLGERLADRVITIGTSSDGRFVATGNAAGLVVVRDTTTLDVVHQLSVADNVVLDVALSPDGATVAAVVNGSGVVVFDVASGRRVQQVESPEARSVAFSPDGSLVAVGGVDGSVSLQDWRQAKEVSRAQLHGGEGGAAVQALLYLGGGSRIASAGMDGSVVISSVPDLQAEVGLKAATLDLRALWTRDDEIGAIDQLGRIFMWDLEDGEPVGRLESDFEVWDATLLDDGQLALGLVESGISVWPLDPQTALARACELAGRPLTEEEWRRFGGEEFDQPTCPADP